mmetsp:Transcript_28984/g.60783  ORF Transcript_28984/g.60783 Transcript_28984/m.60783 type:complete len:279 (-) Transcript_28984:63-899(-)
MQLRHDRQPRCESHILLFNDYNEYHDGPLLDLPSPSKEAVRSGFLGDFPGGRLCFCSAYLLFHQLAILLSVGSVLSIRYHAYLGELTPVRQRRHLFVGDLHLARHYLRGQVAISSQASDDGHQALMLTCLLRPDHRGQLLLLLPSVDLRARRHHLRRKHCCHGIWPQGEAHPSGCQRFRCRYLPPLLVVPRRHHHQVSAGGAEQNLRRHEAHAEVRVHAIHRLGLFSRRIGLQFGGLRGMGQRRHAQVSFGMCHLCDVCPSALRQHDVCPSAAHIRLG